MYKIKVLLICTLVSMVPGWVLAEVGNPPAAEIKTAADQAMQLIKERVNKRQRGLRVIDKIVFLSSGDASQYCLSANEVKALAALRFKTDFAKTSIKLLAGLSETERNQLEKSLPGGDAMARGIMVFDFSSCRIPKAANKLAAYSLTLTIADNDAVADYMAAWDLPVVWNKQLVGAAQEKQLAADVKQRIADLIRNAAADLEKTRK